MPWGLLTIRAGRVLVARVASASSIPVIHPVEPFQAVIVGLAAVLHRHHCEVRHGWLLLLFFFFLFFFFFFFFFLF